MGLAETASKAADNVHRLTGSLAALRSQTAQTGAVGPQAPAAPIVVQQAAPPPAPAEPPPPPPKSASELDRESAEAIRTGQRAQEMKEIIALVRRSIGKR